MSTPMGKTLFSGYFPMHNLQRKLSINEYKFSTGLELTLS